MSGSNSEVGASRVIYGGRQVLQTTHRHPKAMSVAHQPLRTHPRRCRILLWIAAINNSAGLSPVSTNTSEHSVERDGIRKLENASNKHGLEDERDHRVVVLLDVRLHVEEARLRSARPSSVFGISV
jgi:hypothetical protein